MEAGQHHMVFPTIEYSGDNGSHPIDMRGDFGHGGNEHGKPLRFSPSAWETASLVQTLVRWEGAAIIPSKKVLARSLVDIWRYSGTMRKCRMENDHCGCNDGRCCTNDVDIFS